MKQETLSLHHQLVDTIHFLHSKGWAPATSSNYSVREPGQSDFWVSASGIDKGQFALGDLMHVDAAGRPLDDPRRPSAETLIHCYLYETLPKAHCVLHTHSVHNTLLSVAHADVGKLVLAGYEVLKGLGQIKTHDVQVEVPVFPNSQDMVEFTDWVRAYHQQAPDMQGFLIAGHGCYTWGETIAAAKRQMEVFEFLFEVVVKLKIYQG
jgi:methylthioribulose-1-phosphate dehydratase